MSILLHEKTAFEELARPLLTGLAATAYSMTRDRSAAEDLVQETLLKAYRAYDGFEAGTNFRAWIQRILYNTFISDFRRRRNRNERLLSDEVDPESRPAVPDLTSKDLQEIGERLDDRLKHAIERMDPRFREVFMRAAIDDATNSEIAKALDIPVGTVMSRLHRARAFLRHELSTPQ